MRRWKKKQKEDLLPGQDQYLGKPKVLRDEPETVIDSPDESHCDSQNDTSLPRTQLVVEDEVPMWQRIHLSYHQIFAEFSTILLGIRKEQEEHILLFAKARAPEQLLEHIRYQISKTMQK